MRERIVHVPELAAYTKDNVPVALSGDALLLFKSWLLAAAGLFAIALDVYKPIASSLAVFVLVLSEQVHSFTAPWTLKRPATALPTTKAQWLLWARAASGRSWAGLSSTRLSAVAMN